MSLFTILFVAASFVLKLPCVPDRQETYFLPLDEAKADASTLKLTAPDGADVPFSFDARVDVPADWPGLKRRFDGWTSHYNFPVKDNVCWRLGWLSFKAPAGVREVALSFETGSGPTLERKNPSARTWWVNLFRKEPVTDTENGLRVVGNVRVQKADFVDISATGGRRLVTLFRMFAPEGTPDQACFSVGLPNAASSTPNANAGYFGIPPDGCDMVSEGFVKAGVPTAFTDARKGGLAANFTSSCKVNPDKRPIILKEWRIQSAPHVSLGKAKLLSDIFNVGDLVEILPPKGRGDVLVPFEAKGVRGERVVTLAPDAQIDVRAVLKDRAGKAVKSGEGTTFSLAGVAPGRYDLVVTMTSCGVLLGESPIAIGVQEGPWKDSRQQISSATGAVRSMLTSAFL